MNVCVWASRQQASCYQLFLYKEERRHEALIHYHAVIRFVNSVLDVLTTLLS